MAQLAIRGHATRGKEVIKILEMLGGINEEEFDGHSKFAFYFIKDNYIDWCNECIPESDFISFTLEEFLEKFPYKVGDKVIHNKDIELQIVKICWDDEFNIVRYDVQGVVDKTFTLEGLMIAHLQPYKEKPDLLQQLKEYFDNTPREVIEKEWHEYDKYNEIGPKVNKYLEYVNNIRHPKYPKTYEECCKIMNYCYNSMTTKTTHKEGLIRKFQFLLLYRDAYWKIAGEQMGLGKTWEPDWEESDGGYRYCIVNKSNNIALVREWLGKNYVLSFPSVEMRNAFYENFKELIEQCKELL